LRASGARSAAVRYNVVMKCPRKGCQNEAVVDPVFGVLPCLACRTKEAGQAAYRKFQFASLSKFHRVQEQRDKHEADMLQPYLKDGLNPEFFKVYPERIDDYDGALEALEKE